MRSTKPIMAGLVLIIFMICLTQSLVAQVYLDPNKSPNQYNFKTWTTEQENHNLPANTIIKLLQSNDDYIWFASYNGITRFNGIDFKTFNSYSHPEIVNNSFTFVYEDNEGTIWGATSGNGAYAIKNDRVKAYTTKEGLPGNFIESFTQDKRGRFYLATSEGLVYKEGDTFVNTNIPEIFRTMNIVSIDADDKGHLWIGSFSEGVYEVYNDQILTHYNEDNGLSKNEINFVKIQDGKVYIGTRYGLNIIDKGELTSYTTEDGLVGNVVISSELSRNGWLWVGSYKGACRIKDGKIERFSNQHPIHEKNVTSILEDIEGNLWMSTYRSGLFRFWEGKFTNYRDYSLDFNQPYTVHSIIQEDENKFVIVYEEGVDVLDTDNNSLRKFSDELDVSGLKLKCGILDSKGRYWFGTQNNLIRFDGDKIKRFTKKDGLINDNVRVLMEDSKGRIWVGTFFGITVIDEANNDSFNVSVDNGLSHDYIMSIMEDPDGKMWIGTRNGLNVYDKGQITSYGLKDGMAGDFVFKTYYDKDGAVWIMGNAGLTRYKDGHFKKITVNDGLLSTTLFQLIEDDSGYFWFTTNQKGYSLFRVKKDELNAFCDGRITAVTSEGFNKSDGIKSASATSSATSIKATDGKLWIATHRGAEVLDPKIIVENEMMPPVKIELFIINGTERDITEKIEIPYGKNRLKIGYVGLSYRYPENNRYKVKLEGYDDEWIEMNNKLETSYTNLPYGNYTFKVRASNNDGYWSNTNTSVSFVVETPFHKTLWFIVLSVLAAIGLFYMIYLWRIKSLHQKQIELGEIVRERTSEIVKKKEEIEEQKEEIESQRAQISEQYEALIEMNSKLEDIVEQRTLELKKTYRELLDVNKELDTFIYRSAHDIRGPIARLQGLSQLIQLQTTDANILNMVNMLNKTADDMNDVFYRLINIVRLKTSDLDIIEVNILECIQNVRHQFNKRFLKDHFQMEIKVDEGLSVKSNKETIEIILFQLIDNAIKFKKQGEPAYIKIEAFQNDKKDVVVDISDKGMGINKSMEDKIFDMFFVGNDKKGSGLGLYTVRTAAKVLKSQVQLLSNAQEGGVTTFRVVLRDYMQKKE